MKFVKGSVLASTLLITAFLGGCHRNDTGYGYNCYYDVWANYVCEYYYYNADGSLASSRDVVTDVANAQEEHVAVIAEHYAQKFNLSAEQSLKLARTTEDYSVLESRSDQDMADFARRLYGVNPNDIVAAVGSAQAGNREKLNDLVDEAASNFGTTPETMKNIVRSFHGEALAEQGVDL